MLSHVAVLCAVFFGEASSALALLVACVCRQCGSVVECVLAMWSFVDRVMSQRQMKTHRPRKSWLNSLPGMGRSKNLRTTGQTNLSTTGYRTFLDRRSLTRMRQGVFLMTSTQHTPKHMLHSDIPFRLHRHRPFTEQHKHMVTRGTPTDFTGERNAPQKKHKYAHRKKLTEYPPDT